MNDRNSGNQHGRTFDWESARLRIAVTNAILAGLDEPAPGVLEQIWERRAALLAKMSVQEDEGEQIKLVLIQLGRETYGLDAQHVFEIRPANQITPVPRVPDWVAGVINLRGRVLSVLDLRRFFGLAPAEAHDEDEMSPGLELVVVETPSMEVALLTDDVLDVEALPASRVQDATDIVRGIRPEYVRGVVERQDKAGMLVVLDLVTLLADERLIVHEEIV
jgi:purine-binding chemotaxis protein CheW